MTLTIVLPPETERKLLERATQTGQDAVAVARELIERGLSAGPGLDDILAPFRAEVAASGISDEELDALFEEERQQVWQSQHGARQPGQTAQSQQFQQLAPSLRIVGPVEFLRDFPSQPTTDSPPASTRSCLVQQLHGSKTLSG